MDSTTFWRPGQTIRAKAAASTFTSETLLLSLHCTLGQRGGPFKVVLIVVKVIQATPVRTGGALPPYFTD
jgi:hypothetical protein